MPGHVFVVRADIRRLVCDAWLLPTDGRPHVTSGWFETPPEAGPATRDWLERFRTAVAEATREPFGRREHDVRLLDGARSTTGAVPVLARTAVAWDHVDWDQVARALHAFARAARRLPRSGPASRRARPLLAVPVVGTGHGGGADLKGEALDRLLHQLADVADGVDVALVTSSDAMTAAARSHRRSGDHRSSFLRELGPDLVEEAQRLAARARRGEVVLFTGAGTGVPAGLPTWEQLLARIAPDGAFADDEMAALPALDKAAIIERQLGRAGLLTAVATAVGTDSYALGHALLANLPVTESATLNYDELYETASRDAGRRLAVLPYERPGEGYDGWLLKLHGCVREDRRADIVLTRADYLSLASHRAALTGLLQAMLVTRHMLFVGFGLGDEHFHAIVHDVRRALRPAAAGEGQAAPPGEPFGTALVLRPQKAAELVWGEDLRLVATGGPDPARRLEIFLDLLATEADQGWQHVLDPAYASVLAGPEVALRAHLDQLVADRAVLEGGGAWPAVEAMLRRFGWDEAAREASADPAESPF
jgi:hypothetical protein